jgi:hypothetical protein
VAVADHDDDGDSAAGAVGEDGGPAGSEHRSSGTAARPSSDLGTIADGNQAGHQAGYQAGSGRAMSAGDEEGLPDERSRFLAELGKWAMEERLRNTVIDAKGRGLGYMSWLIRYVGHTDYDVEFTERARTNGHFHDCWNRYSRDDVPTHKFTDDNDEIESSKVTLVLAS